MRSGILTLTTDFGADGPYVAAMKGVVLGIAPEARLVDVSHAIAPQDVREAGFVLGSVVGAFPPGTVHLAVVDPGVGTDRRLVAALADDQWFVLPDNGLLGQVLGGREPSAAWEILNPSHRRASVSNTFHGRDILAPAAAFLLGGGDPADLGPPIADLVTLPEERPEEDGSALGGRVVFVDHFGNLITNLTREHLGATPPGGWALEIAGGRIDGLIGTYGDRPPGTLVALIGSSDRVEAAVVYGSAASRLGVGRGAPVRLLRLPEQES